MCQAPHRLLVGQAVTSGCAAILARRDQFLLVVRPTILRVKHAASRVIFLRDVVVVAQLLALSLGARRSPLAATEAGSRKRRLWGASSEAAAAIAVLLCVRDEREQPERARRTNKIEKQVYDCETCEVHSGNRNFISKSSTVTIMWQNLLYSFILFFVFITS